VTHDRVERVRIEQVSQRPSSAQRAQRVAQAHRPKQRDRRALGLQRARQPALEAQCEVGSVFWGAHRGERNEHALDATEQVAARKLAQSLAGRSKLRQDSADAQDNW
jgi:hypothetical protein